MGIFASTFFRLISEDVTAATAFGPAAGGTTAGQFPANNSKGFAPGDNRPIDPYKAVLGAKNKKGKKKNTKKIPFQRRNFAKM